MESSIPPPLRNRSLAAGKAEPDLPNRSPRPRLRSIRWVREPLDEPEVYPLGPGVRSRPSIRPPVPSRLGIHCIDRAWQRVQTGMFVHKEPDVVLSIVNDQARLYMQGLTYGNYFAVWIVTEHMEKAIAVFTLDDGEHIPEAHLGDRATQSAELGNGDFKPLVIIEDGAIQEQAFSGEHIPEVHLGDQASQAAALTDGQSQPEISMTDKSQSAHAIANGDFRPMVFLNEKATNLISTADGEHFLEINIQQMLEKAAQTVLFERGAHDVPIFEVIVNDKGYLQIATDAGIYVLYYPLDNLGTYTDNAPLDGLNDGRFWAGPFVGRNNITGIQVADNVEAYSDGAGLTGLNLGLWTNHPYVARDGVSIPAYDNMEAYADAAPVNGLNGGVGFTYGPYVDRENYIIVNDDEDFESYTVQSPVTDTLNGGPRGWTGAWVFSPIYAPNFVSDEDFEAYSVQDPVVDPLNAGFGWTGNWSLGGIPVNGSTWKTGGASDNFELYADENPVVSTLNDGVNWSTSWAIFDQTILTARDSFETYADENPVVSTLNGGTNWAGAWVTP